MLDLTGERFVVVISFIEPDDVLVHCISVTCLFPPLLLRLICNILLYLGLLNVLFFSCSIMLPHIQRSVSSHRVGGKPHGNCLVVALNTCADDDGWLQCNIRFTPPTLFHWHFDVQLAMGAINTNVLARRFSEIEADSSRAAI